MPRQSMVFTALPDGPDLAGPLRMSVFLSPRLFPDAEVGVLTDFPDLAPWPDTLARISWFVRVDGVVVPARVVTPEQVAPDSAWWRALLPGTAPVRGHTQPDYADREVVSYDVGAALGQLRRIWQNVLSGSPTAIPGNRDLLGQVAAATGLDLAELDRLLGELLDPGQQPEGPDDAPPGDLDERPDVDVDVHTYGPGPEERRWRYDQEAAWIARQREAAQAYEAHVAEREAHRRRVADVRAELDPEAMLHTALAALYAVRDFHEPRVRAADGAAHTRPVLPKYDVHQLIAMLGGHPALLRRLGLIVDLELPLPAPHVGGAGLQVLPDWVPTLEGDPAVITPRTRLDPTTFRAAADGADGQVERGYLRVRDADATPRLTPVVADADGAALKTLTAVEGLIRRLVWRDHRLDETSDGLPTLRSAGMALALSARGAALKAAFVKARARDAAFRAATPDAPADVDADDLTRGWRLDVRPAGGDWLGTAARQARYTVAGPAPLEVAEEGAVTPTASGEGDAKQKPGGALYVPESLFLWQGWSLAVPRPGTPIDTADQVGHPDPLQPAGPLGVDYRFRAVPGTLPPLRFGRSYGFRLRAVDLAGNGPALGDAEPAGVATDDVPYLRFDPVSPPEVLPRSARGPGDGPLRVVLRSDIEGPPAPATAERHLVPPRTSQLLAEQHGMLDVDGRPSVSAYRTLAAVDGPSEAGTYAGLPGATQDPEFPGTGGKDDPGAWYVDLDRLPMVYLPDPLSAGAALRGLPGGADLLVPFAPPDGQVWPRLQPFRLVLQEGEPAQSWDPGRRVLDVWLPKGERREVDLSSWLDPAALALLGLREWYLQLAPDAGRAQAFDLSAQRGEVWALTPPRRLLLLHAVKRPTKEPQLLSLAAVRAPGQSYAVLTGQLDFSRSTTGGVDLVAQWNEPLDAGRGNVDAAAGGPEPVADPDPAEVRSSVLPVPLADGALDPDRLGLARRQDFGDGRHREITYRAVATTAFLEYFTRQRQVTVPADLPGEVPLDPDGVVPRTVVLTDADGAAYRLRDAANPDGAFTVDEATGVLRFDGTGLRPAALAVLQATYNVPEVTRTSAPVTVRVPASVRPAPPKVLYVVPTYAWSGGGSVTEEPAWSARRGNSLRVYLDRPWWSSGAGELLGVVLLPPPAVLTDDARQYVTGWGDDAVGPGRAPLPERPGLAHLPEAVRAGSGIRAEELPYRRVDVAGFDVAFDAGRKLWSCDIAIDSGVQDRTYQPFVRLALARWQPDALPGLELSRVVMADFIQLGVDRAASVVTDAELESLVLTVSGTVPRERNAARAWIEMPVPGITDPELGWARVEGTQVDLAHVVGTGWQGRLRLPEAYAPGRFRLVLQEVEQYPLSPVDPTIGERLVYLDVLPL